MPPKAVRTVRDLIYWQYAKLIAESAGYGKTKNYGFIMDRFKQLKNGEFFTAVDTMIVEGKYLKLLYTLHEKEGTLEVDIKDLDKLCKICDLGNLCEETSLTVYCLESILKK
ncbi:MAG: hypothetical protein L6282_03830 [Candidatus Methanoperedenaceae archaeon]|nr:hypothetical protein [Candidatus Methanoperedenaceae archaeon]